MGGEPLATAAWFAFDRSFVYGECRIRFRLTRPLFGLVFRQ
jgi:hypothetical protein